MTPVTCHPQMSKRDFLSENDIDNRSLNFHDGLDIFGDSDKENGLADLLSSQVPSGASKLLPNLISKTKARTKPLRLDLDLYFLLLLMLPIT